MQVYKIQSVKFSADESNIDISWIKKHLTIKPTEHQMHLANERYFCRT